MSESKIDSTSDAPVSRRRATLWNMTFGYGMLALTICRNFLLVPLFFRFIGDYEYKAWLASGGAAVQLLAIDFGLMGALSQMVASAYGKRENERVERLVGTGMLISLALAGLVMVVGIAIAYPLPGWIGVSGEAADHISSAFVIVSVANGLQLLAIAIKAVLNSLQQPFWPGLHGVVAEVLALVTTISLLYAGFGLKSVALGLLVRSIWSLASNAWHLTTLFLHRLGLRFAWERGLVKMLWNLSVYQFLAQIAGRMHVSLPPFLIGMFMGSDAAGTFALTTRAHDMIRTITMVIGGSVTPSLTHLYGEGKRDRFREIMLSRVRAQVLFGAIAILGVIALNEPFMRLWVGSEHFAGQAINVMIGIAVFVNVLTSIGYDGLYCMGALRRTGVFVLAESIVRLGVMAALTYSVGLIGVPIAIIVIQGLLNTVPFFITLTKWLNFHWSELKAVLYKCVGSVTISILAGSIVMPFGSWVDNWFRLTLAGIVYSLIAGALGAAWERPLIRSFRRAEAS